MSYSNLLKSRRRAHLKARAIFPLRGIRLLIRTSSNQSMRPADAASSSHCSVVGSPQYRHVAPVGCRTETLHSFWPLLRHKHSFPLSHIETRRLILDSGASRVGIPFFPFLETVHVDERLCNVLSQGKCYCTALANLEE